MKWPFSRKDNTANIPSEIQDYYQAERRERTGIAWLLGLGTLLATVVIVLGLFMGGRWVYRKVTNDDKKQPATTGEFQEDDGQPASNGQTGGSNTTQNTPAPTTPTPSQTSPAPATTPVAGSALPRTGPEGEE